MTSLPGMPNAPNQGLRQQRAAQLKAEMEARPRDQQTTDAPDEAPQEAPPEQEQTPAAGTGPVGQGEYVVKQGDCISSIAKEMGHFWEKIWNDPNNAELKEVRKDPNVLLTGDRVAVPEVTPKQEPGETEMRHRFVRRGEPAKLRLRLLRGPRFIDDQHGDEPLQPGDPCGGVPYRLVVDQKQFEGVTDANGWFECPIPGNARQGMLAVKPETDDEEVFDLDLGQVDPSSELRGVKKRLANLGFECGEVETDAYTPQVKEALLAFQAEHNLPETGKADAETRAKLVELHGC